MLANLLRAQARAAWSCSRARRSPGFHPAVFHAGRIRHIETTSAPEAESFSGEYEEGDGSRQVARPQQPPLETTSSVFVHNLPYTVTREELSQLFQKYDVSEIRMQTTPDGENLGHANIVFSGYNTARDVLEDFKAKPLMLSGRVVRMEPVRVNNPRKLTGISRTVYIGNLPFSAEHDEIRALIKPFGAIEGIRILYDSETHLHRGFVHVDFKNIQEAQRFVEHFHNYPVALLGRNLVINYGETQSKAVHPRNEFSIVAQRFHADVQEDDIAALFKRFGTIAAIRIGGDKGRAIAFVDFDTHEAAKAAVEKFSEKPLTLDDGSTMHVTFALLKKRVEYPPSRHLFMPHYDDSRQRLKAALGMHARNVMRVSFYIKPGTTSRSVFLDFDTIENATLAKEAFFGNPGPLTSLSYSRPRMDEPQRTPTDQPASVHDWQSMVNQVVRKT
ncbi:Poly(U)-binding-splicing factor PUF60 [Grifola frondosa]|uniref:Poly(U)-binding-splicing factor PUF60 n=1 Tax=Grifola frondosa TaxID=5627 RepID=A0A1C7MDE1_GRIFR|nr:Poly(U)-binding-splicing factor PUF60 [Grifola frondosa]